MIKREEFTFDSRDHKTKIHAMRWIPQNPPVCIVQLVHGMAEYVERYDAFARFLAEHDILVVGDDHLGHGRTVSAGNGVYGYFCEQDAATVLVRDEHRLKKLTQEQYPGLPYIIIGHSMGSFILQNYLFRYGKGIDGAVILSTGNHSDGKIFLGKMLAGACSVFHKQTHPSEFLNVATFGTYMRKIRNRRTVLDWVCSDSDVVDKYFEDDECGFTFTINGFKTLYELAKRCNNKENLTQIPKKLPILIASGTDDPVGNYGETPQKLYDTYLNLDMTKVQLKLYKGARHELLNETIKEEVYKDLLNWILAIRGN